MFRLGFPFRKYFNTAPDGAAAGAAAPAAGAPGSTTPPVQPAAAGTPGGGAPAGTEGQPGQQPANRYSYSEDRSSWIPPHRLEEVRRGEQQRYQALETRFNDLDGRMRRFFDVPQQQDPRHAELRRSFAEIMPELAPFLDPRNQPHLRGLLELLQSGQLEELRATGSSYWNRHANTFARDAATAFAKEVGVEVKDLPAHTVNRMALHLQAFIQEDRSGQRYQRYEYGDPALIEEWLADMKSMFVTPMRTRMASQGAATAERNRRLPQGGQRGAMPPGGGQPPARLRGKDLMQAARRYASGEGGADAGS
jgi:hypothetical protein